jgi:TRAP transporter 4TM/12TM fusion protein
MPGLFAHKNYGTDRIIDTMFITADGVFGMLAGISATFIFLFILFGALLREAGGGEFFINFAYGICGRFRGGPAKIAIVASSLFGMLSGSGTANVAGTGQITIPLMKRSGYPAYFAGAVETVASAGGLLMPPIMGSAVFIMMEIIGVNYLVIIKASILMAVLYFLGLFLMVDIEAQKIGLVGLKKVEIPPLKKTLKEGWHFFIPLLVLIYFLGIERSSVTRAALWANLSIPLIAMMRKHTRMSLSKILSGLEKGALTAAPVVAILSLGGIVVGMITLTGLGLMMSSILIELSHGNLFLLLMMTMFASIILGMGVPPVAAYIILAILVVPALIKMGVYPLAAHLFVFYFGTIAGITPPMAPDAFVAAGIADSPMMKTAFTACRLALVIFILPYIFVYNNALLMIGNFWQILWVSLTALLGVFALASAVQNFMGKTLPLLFRIVLLGSSLSLIIPGYRTDFLGMVFLFSIMLYQMPQLGNKFKGYLSRG